MIIGTPIGVCAILILILFILYNCYKNKNLNKKEEIVHPNPNHNQIEELN